MQCCPSLHTFWGEGLSLPCFLSQNSVNVSWWSVVSGQAAVAQVLKVPQGEYLLQNGANSVLGKQLIALAHKRGIKTINIVRIYWPGHP